VQGKPRLVGSGARMRKPAQIALRVLKSGEFFNPASHGAWQG